MCSNRQTYGKAIANFCKCPQAVRSAGLGRRFGGITVVAHAVGVRAELSFWTFFFDTMYIDFVDFQDIYNKICVFSNSHRRLYKFMKKGYKKIHRS